MPHDLFDGDPVIYPELYERYRGMHVEGDQGPSLWQQAGQAVGGALELVGAGLQAIGITESYQQIMHPPFLGFDHTAQEHLAGFHDAISPGPATTPYDQSWAGAPGAPEPLGGMASELIGLGAGAAIGRFLGPQAGIAAGIMAEGIAETFFEGRSQPEVSAFAGGGTDMGMEPHGNRFMYIKVNPMTGLRYGRLFDGRMVYERKNGTIKTYRPKKPIVLMPGSISLSQASRAATALGRIAKRMKKSKFKAFL